MSRTAASERREERLIVSSQVSAELRRELERLAAEADRTLSAEVRRALQRHVDNEKRDG